MTAELLVEGARTGIVLAHGRGGTATGILDLVDAAGLGNLSAIAPQADGQSWWPVSFLSADAEIAHFVARGVRRMSQAVHRLESLGIARDHIWLAGFSQGACLALETFAREGGGLAGVFGFSGGLTGTSDAASQPLDELYGYSAKNFDYSGTRDGAKVWLSVHERDPHIPLNRVQKTATVLTALGAEVTTRVYNGAGHGVLPDDIAALGRLAAR